MKIIERSEKIHPINEQYHNLKNGIGIITYIVDKQLIRLAVNVSDQSLDDVYDYFKINKETDKSIPIKFKFNLDGESPMFPVSCETDG
jgi:hypothetical protein